MAFVSRTCVGSDTAGLVEADPFYFYPATVQRLRRGLFRIIGYFTVYLGALAFWLPCVLFGSFDKDEHAIVRTRRAAGAVDGQWVCRDGNLFGDMRRSAACSRCSLFDRVPSRIPYAIIRSGSSVHV